MFGKAGFSFFENGIVSLNLPPAHDVLGARATRTTHPRVIRGFKALFSALVGEPVDVRTPFLWRTKKEVVELIVEQGFGQLLAATASCVHPHDWTENERHCGVCSQCIDRRFAVLAAGAVELEPGSGYLVDLLTGARVADADLRMAVAYVKFCQTLVSCSRDQLIIRFPQVTSVLNDIAPLSSREALDRIWQLHRRHAEGVLQVISDGLAHHGHDLLHGNLPESCILALSVGRSRVEARPELDVQKQLADFVDRLASPVCEFAVDDLSRRVWFRGGFFLDSADYRLFTALLVEHRPARQKGADVGFTTSADLLGKLGYTDEQTLRQQVARTRARLADRLTVDQGVVLPKGFIESKRLQGYRLSPELREVTLADLRIADSAASHGLTSNVTQASSPH
jgi:hypothetical protein